MQPNIDPVSKQWLNDRGITDKVLSLFGVSSYHHPTIGDCIRIPYTATHSKYRRHPLDDARPKYLYDPGGKVTLYGADKLTGQGVVLVTEGELDTLVAWSHNIQAVSSTGGAMSFQEDWVEQYHLNKVPVYVCFDNDNAGVDGMLRVLTFLPNAHIVLIPEQPGVKDISDYVGRGGNLHKLLATAKQFRNAADVEADKQQRDANWQSTRFHDRYLEKLRNQHDRAATPNPYTGSDRVLRAKTYPLTNLIAFKRRKARCPWHNEKTPSLHYYPKTNSAYCFGGCGRAYDVIDAYRLKYPHLSFPEVIEELNKLVP